MAAGTNFSFDSCLIAATRHRASKTRLNRTAKIYVHTFSPVSCILHNQQDVNHDTMAVLPGVPGISVQIRISGEIATEYHDSEQRPASESDGLSSHRYIESRAGAEFAIETTVTPEYRLRNGHNALVVWPKIDGYDKLIGKILYLNPVRLHPNTIAHSATYTASDTPNMANKANFVFVPITTSRLTSFIFV